MPDTPVLQFAVVERDRPVLQDLVGLVPLAGQDDDVAGLRALQRHPDGLLAIRLGQIRRVMAAQPNHRVVDYG
jgi:hypothetical protein